MAAAQNFNVRFFSTRLNQAIYLSSSNEGMTRLQDTGIIAAQIDCMWTQQHQLQTANTANFCEDVSYNMLEVTYAWSDGKDMSGVGFHRLVDKYGSVSSVYENILKTRREFNLLKREGLADNALLCAGYLAEVLYYTEQLGGNPHGDKEKEEVYKVLDLFNDTLPGATRKNLKNKVMYAVDFIEKPSFI